MHIVDIIPALLTIFIVIAVLLIIISIPVWLISVAILKHSLKEMNKQKK